MSITKVVSSPMLVTNPPLLTHRLIDGPRGRVGLHHVVDALCLELDAVAGDHDHRVRVVK